jgi:DMSO reductase family type II enzyme heme b subunit
VAAVLGGLVLYLLLGSVGRAESRRAPVAPEELEAGRQVYLRYCAICHGVDGDGAGPAAELLQPRPRDFRQGLYKIRTTVSGDLPTDEDLFRVVSKGMPGSSMPGWEEVLSEKERWQVVAYIKTFDRFYDPDYQPESVPLSKRIAASPESIARGRELYRELECWKCHGDAGRGDGPSALELEDEWGFPILPADLTQNWTFRGGGEVEDIYMRFSTGMNGTPMPAFAEDVLSDEDRWHLANFVRSLSPERPPEVKAVIEAVPVEGELPLDPGDPVWEQVPRFYYPLVGQIMMPPRWFTPSITSVFVQAMYNEREIALRLTWNDRTQSLGDEGPPDAAAVQFPATIPEGTEKPYFYMGDLRHPVNRWHWDASANSVRELTATGPGTEVPQANQSLSGQAVFDAGQWRLVFKRPLNTGDAEDIQFEQGEFIPIAFQVWDGYYGEEGERGAVSTWYSLFLRKRTSATAYVWIPAVMLLAAAAEWGVFQLVRRRMG